MATQLSSRERLLCAINHQEPDHVPLWNLWSHQENLPFSWQNPIERVEKVLGMGLDDTLLLRPPGPGENDILVEALMAPGVKARCGRETSAAHRYPLLVKEYETPAGMLRQVVRETEDWPYGADVPVFSDYCVSRSVEFLIKGPEDLEKLSFLLTPPSAEQVESFKERARPLEAFAKDHGVLVEGGWINVGDAAIWLCGVEPLLTAAMDDPGFVEELLRILYDWQRPRIELLLEEGIDVLAHRGWYESTAFWSPGLYRRLLKPLVRKEVELAHDAGVKFSYIMTTGVMPLVEDFLDLGIDILWGVDPVQGDADLPVLKEKLGETVCLWGGMNSAVTLGHGTREEVRDAVTYAIHTLAPGGGFVLFPVDQIFEDTPWENIEIMIERWREIGTYGRG